MTGRYVAFEGIEGAGKTTVCAGVAAALEAAGHRVTLLREPGGTSAGEEIRRLLLDPAGSLAPWTEALLFAAARAQLAADVIRPALAAGGWVLTDRSVYSSLAYQGGGRALGVEAVRAINTPGLAGVWPDLVILLDVSPEQGLARQQVADRIGAEGVDFQGRVAAAFETLATSEPERFRRVDAMRPLSAVVSDCVGLLLEPGT